MEKVDKQLRRALESLASSGSVGLTKGEIPSIRAAHLQERVPIEDLLSKAGLSKSDHLYSGKHHLELSVITSPSTRVGSPFVLYFHGGGMVFGDRFSGLTQQLEWVTKLGVALVTVDYRLAPEFTFPAQIEDARSALLWVIANARELGLDPGSFVVAGASAGGCIAASLVSSQPHGPDLTMKGVALIAPMLDAHRGLSPSSNRSKTPVWDSVSNWTAWTSYFGSNEIPDHEQATANPIDSPSLDVFPSTYIEVGSVDLFRDECVLFAQRLMERSVEVDLHVWSGAFHGFANAARESRLAVLSAQAQLTWLSKVLFEEDAALGK